MPVFNVNSKLDRTRRVLSSYAVPVCDSLNQMR